MRKILVVLMSAGYLVASAQNLSDKTNAISLNLVESKTSESLPKIEWQHPKMNHTNSKGNKVAINTIINSEKLIKKLTLTIANDKTGKVMTSRDFDIDTITYQFNVDQSLWLPNGTSSIQISATNIDGVTVSSTRRISVGKDVMEDLLAIDRKDYALLFATDRYDYWDDLVNPIDDAHAIGKTLEDLYGFEVEIVENASLEEVWGKLREYSDKRFGPQDQLMIFFAGHGHYDESFGEGYVVASNSLNNDKARTSYISHNRLRGVVDNISCEHILLTMDVCFGGTLDPSIARNRGPKSYEVSVSDMLARKFQKKTRKYLTSGGKEYVSDGIPGKHSPFASKLLEAYKTEGGDDRVLTMSEIQVNMENLAQVPRFGAFGADEALSDFVFIAR
ncbi:caspase family protein [Ekhidna sp.]|uniref:caspase family protein n=1 Tax=Ekhidna sp. TaxID=2608089 RepID=UPI003C7A8ED5